MSVASVFPRPSARSPPPPPVCRPMLFLCPQPPKQGVRRRVVGEVDGGGREEVDVQMDGEEKELRLSSAGDSDEAERGVSSTEGHGDERYEEAVDAGVMLVDDSSLSLFPGPVVPLPSPSAPFESLQSGRKRRKSMTAPSEEKGVFDASIPFPHVTPSSHFPPQ